MKIVHIASYKDEFFNGIKSVLVDLVPSQRALGHEIWVLNHEKNEIPVIEGEQYVGGQKDLKKWIKQINPDIVIFHSLYGLGDVFFSYHLRRMKIPYMVEPHGGTSLENSKKSRIKKKIANVLYANSFIKHAQSIIYLNQKEKEECVFSNIRRCGIVIPNGTHLHSNCSRNNSEGKVRFIFLARIDINQKGLDLLFPAIEEANTKGLISEAEFHFYGKARQPQWKKEFELYISNASPNVQYHGAVDGDDKERAYLNSDIFILPSRYEGMPMAVLEALSYGIPCLLTEQTNLADVIIGNDCGWIAETTVESICGKIFDAVNDYKLRHEALHINALNAAKLFDWESIAKQSIQAYSCSIGYPSI